MDGWMDGLCMGVRGKYVPMPITRAYVCLQPARDRPQPPRRALRTKLQRNARWDWMDAEMDACIMGVRKDGNE